MPVRPIRPPALAMLMATALLAGCARHAPPQTAAAEPVADVPPRPTLPAGYGAVTPPPRDADGRYRTINAGLDPQATIWHVRAALNVAAIGCRGPEAAGIVPAYNAMLSSKKAVLARAQKSVQAALQASAGKDWQSADDTAMTRLYNYFAMPAAKPAFCEAAAALAPEAAAAAPDAFAPFAGLAMTKLEAPFVAVYRAVDDHRIELAQWEARYGAGTGAAATATPPSAAPVDRTTTATATATVALKPAPRLAYADMTTVIAWTPPRRAAYAAR